MDVKPHPISSQPPSVSSESTATLLKAAQNDSIDQAGRQDGGGKEGEKKVKTEKDCMGPGHLGIVYC